MLPPITEQRHRNTKQSQALIDSMLVSAKVLSPSGPYKTMKLYCLIGLSADPLSLADTLIPALP